VSDGEQKKPIDDDILQSKADILRARDIIPGKPKPSDTDQPDKKQTPQQQEIAQEGAESGAEEAQNEDTTVAESAEKEAEIPQFDLAQDILAEQRKAAAVRRKGPASQAKAEGERAQARLEAHVVEPPAAEPDADRIITEIVARDIERLCGGESSTDSG
jgi:hypothetical protein